MLSFSSLLSTFNCASLAYISVLPAKAIWLRNYSCASFTVLIWPLQVLIVLRIFVHALFREDEVLWALTAVLVMCLSAHMSLRCLTTSCDKKICVQLLEKYTIHMTYAFTFPPIIQYKYAHTVRRVQKYIYTWPTVLANPAQVYLTHPTLVAQWSCYSSL